MVRGFTLTGGYRGHSGRVVTLSPSTSEAGVRCLARPQVEKLSTEPWWTVCTGFLCPSNYPSWYDLYSVESDVKPQINKLTGGYRCWAKCLCLFELLGSYWERLAISQMLPWAWFNPRSTEVIVKLLHRKMSIVWSQHAALSCLEESVC